MQILNVNVECQCLVTTHDVLMAQSPSVLEAGTTHDTRHDVICSSWPVSEPLEYVIINTKNENSAQKRKKKQKGLSCNERDEMGGATAVPPIVVERES